MSEAKKAPATKAATSKPPAPAPVLDEQPPAPAPVLDPAALQAEIDRLRGEATARREADLQAEIDRLRGLVPVDAAPVNVEAVPTVEIADVEPGTYVRLADSSGAYALVTGPSEVLVLGTPQRHECDVIPVG